MGFLAGRFVRRGCINNRLLQLGKGFILDLAHAFAADAEISTDVFEREWLVDQPALEQDLAQAPTLVRRRASLVRHATGPAERAVREAARPCQASLANQVVRGVTTMMPSSPLLI